MNAIALQHFWPTVLSSENGLQKDRFREKFQRSLRSCVRRGFTVEEAFGMIWVETWEEVAVSEEEQSSLYEELIQWAKTKLPDEEPALTTFVHKSYSPTRATL